MTMLSIDSDYPAQLLEMYRVMQRSSDRVIVLFFSLWDEDDIWPVTVDNIKRCTGCSSEYADDALDLMNRDKLVTFFLQRQGYLLTDYGRDFRKLVLAEHAESIIAAPFSHKYISLQIMSNIRDGTFMLSQLKNNFCWLPEEEVESAVADLLAYGLVHTVRMHPQDMTVDTRYALTQLGKVMIA